jgi:uncharacterized cupredoxin-like copper-binding protein
MQWFAGLIAFLIGALILPVPAAAQSSGNDAEDADVDVPTLYLDQSARAVQYQLQRLSDAQLVAVDRTPHQAKYRPVYMALLTRPGMDRAYRREALAAVMCIDRASAAAVTIDALSKLDKAETETAAALTELLLAQPRHLLEKHRAVLAKAVQNADKADKPFALQAAFAGLMTADGAPDAAWTLASKNTRRRLALLRSVARLGHAPLKRALYSPIASLIDKTDQPEVRRAAVAALGHTRGHGAEAFEILAKVVHSDKDTATRVAAIRGLLTLGPTAWPKDAGAVTPVVEAIAALLEQTDPAARTEPGMIDAVRLGKKLSRRLPEAEGKPLRDTLQSLGVRIIEIDTVPEAMAYDRNWFVVEAGQPVQIILRNRDALPHNLILAEPGSVKKIGLKAATLGQPDDPEAKAYVPDMAEVLEATALLQQGETARLTFTAPDKPADYDFLCSYPGHWTRMNGVMRVVADRAEYDPASAKPPRDPVSGQRYSSKMRASQQH